MSGFLLTTARLRLRELGFEDAPFLVRLLNDAAFLEHIGDRGVRSVADAREYLVRGPHESYSRHGHGLWCVEARDGAEPLGLCGLLKRPTLADVDLGFALLPEARGRGIASEAARAVLAHGFGSLGLTRIAAIVAPGNRASIRVLLGLGMREEALVRLAGDRNEVLLFGLAAPPASRA